MTMNLVGMIVFIDTETYPAAEPDAPKDMVPIDVVPLDAVQRSSRADH